MIRFIECQEPGYAARTVVNARSADLTIAFAVNFKSSGEILTRKAAYGKWFGIDLCSDGWDIMGACNDAHKRIIEKKVKILNIAGNGIYTLTPKYTQEMLDADILLFLQRILSGADVKIRSGGQTGVDEAALKVGDKLGLDCTCLAPKNWLFRDINGKDHMHDPDAFCARFGPAYINDI